MKKYEFDLQNESFLYTVAVTNYFRKLYKDIYFRSFIDQLKKSVSSMSANIEEGKFSNSNKELARYYEIALKSGNETKHWLKVLAATMTESAEEITRLLPKAEELTRILAASIIALRRKKK